MNQSISNEAFENLLSLSKTREKSQKLFEGLWKHIEGLSPRDSEMPKDLE